MRKNNIEDFDKSYAEINKGLVNNYKDDLNNNDNNKSDGKDLSDIDIGDTSLVGENNDLNYNENKTTESNISSTIVSNIKNIFVTNSIAKRFLLYSLLGSLGLSPFIINSLVGGGSNVVLFDLFKKEEYDCEDDYNSRINAYNSDMLKAGNIDEMKLKNAKMLYSFFKGVYNMSDEKIAAILGNLEEETTDFNFAKIEGISHYPAKYEGKYLDPILDKNLYSRYSQMYITKHNYTNKYYRINLEKYGYKAFVGIGLMQMTGAEGAKYIEFCKTNYIDWKDPVSQLAYLSTLGNYRNESAYTGRISKLTYFEYFAKMDYSDVSAANSGLHFGFGKGGYANVKSAFNMNDVDKLARVFCVGYLGNKSEDNYKRRSAKALAWLPYIKTFTVDESIGNSVLSITRANISKASLNSIINNDKCSISSNLYSNSSIANAAISLAYYDRADAVGNDGTSIYQKVYNYVGGRGVKRSCAAVVMSAVRWSGSDDKYPATDDVLTQAKYLSSGGNGRWTKLNDVLLQNNAFRDLATLKSYLKPGDILVFKNGFKTGDNVGNKDDIVSHIVVYVGNELVNREYPNGRLGDFDIVEGSYSSNYSKARSAALGRLTNYRLDPKGASRYYFQVYRCTNPQKEKSKYSSMIFDDVH